MVAVARQIVSRQAATWATILLLQATAPAAAAAAAVKTTCFTTPLEGVGVRASSALADAAQIAVLAGGLERLLAPAVAAAVPLLAALATLLLSSPIRRGVVALAEVGEARVLAVVMAGGLAARAVALATQ